MYILATDKDDTELEKALTTEQKQKKTVQLLSTCATLMKYFRNAHLQRFLASRTR